MTRWAAQLIVALRRAGWPAPLHFALGVGWCRFFDFTTSLCIWDDYVLAVTEAGDRVKIKGPPGAVAECLQHWRSIADG